MTRFYHSYIFRRSEFFLNFFLKAFFPALLISAVLFLDSCEKNPSLIGTELLPGSDFVDIKSTDTISVVSYTAYEDSIQSDNASTSFLGGIYDPYFGLTTAELVTQLRLRAKWKPQPFYIDSVKLNLALYNVSGNVSGTHKLRFQEIAKQIYLDSTYYSNTQIPLADPSTYWEVTLPKLKIDTVNYVEVFVPVEFGEHIMRDTTMLFHDNSKPDFRSYFKGLKISLISQGDPVFTSLSLAPPQGGYYNYFTVFYSVPGGTSGQYYFIMDALSKNARFNLYSHDFAAAAPDKRIRNLNDRVLDTVSYVQGLNGAFTKIVLPGLEKIKNDTSMKKIAINRARLVIPVYTDNSLYKGSKMATQLYIRYKTNSGQKFFVPDYSPNNNFFDGKVDTVANVVKFNIASFVQKYLEDKTNTINPEVEIFETTGTMKNAILKTKKSHSPAKFEFTYTRF